jgi:hypothetical protein
MWTRRLIERFHREIASGDDVSDILVRLDQYCDNDGGSRSDTGLSTGTHGDNNVAPDLPANNNVEQPAPHQGVSDDDREKHDLSLVRQG